MVGRLQILFYRLGSAEHQRHWRRNGPGFHESNIMSDCCNCERRCANKTTTFACWTRKRGKLTEQTGKIAAARICNRWMANYSFAIHGSRKRCYARALTRAAPALTAI